MFLPAFSRPARLRRLAPALALLCLAALARPAGASALFVPSQYATIQAAINASVNGDLVLVDDGTYAGPGNVDVDFGGRNVTVRSQNGASSTFIDCGGSANAFHRAFILHSGETSAVIQGFTIENGYEAVGNGGPNSFGGGISNTSLGLTVQNCVLKNNSAYFGGGVYNDNNGGGTLKLISCVFLGNTASGEGGGVFNENDTAGACTMTRCTLTGNAAPNGGGIFNRNAGGGTLTLASCTLAGNAAGSYGGGLYDDSDGGVSTLTDCVLTGNTVNNGGIQGGFGDAVYNYVAQNGTFTAFNCTLTGNSDSTSPCLYNVDTGGGTTILTNDILYGDAGGEITNGLGTLTASYCDVQGGYPGTANVAADPLFVSASNLQLQPGSPCLGAGTASGAPTRTIDAQTRPNPPSIGAYEKAPAAPTPTTLTLASSLNPSTAGQFVLFTANVVGGGIIVSGTVTFTVDGTPRPPVSINGGHSVNYLTSTLSVGSHTLSAAYSGDTNYGPSTSPTLTQVVNPHVNPQYVSPAGNDANFGTQASPKLTIQAAINATLNGDTVIVEDGTYAGPGDVDLDFGGSNLTVTSQNGPAATVIDCGGAAGPGHRGFYVHSGETNAVISGFTIQNGLPTGQAYGQGGAIYNASGGLTVQNCVLRNNVAYNSGGGVYNGGTLSLIGCTLTGNAAPGNGNPGLGGAIDNESGTLTLTACTITGNSAGGGGNGGGLYNSTSYNGAAGVGVFTLSDCVLSGNSASGGYGGGLYTSAYYGANTVTNCTFTANTASTGGGLFSYIGGGGGSTVTLTNDIAYGDTSGSGGDISGVFTTVRNCDVQGGYTGTANVNADPLFVSATDLRLQPGSPCLGAGTASGAPATTIDGQTRPNPPSMGAYEASPLAATSETVANVTGSAGQTVTLSAVLKTGAGVALTGQTLTFSVDGTAAGAGVTNSSGVATKTYAIPTTLSVGSHTLTAAFAGDATNAASSGTGTLTATKANTAVTVGARAGKAGTTVALKAYLKTAAGVVLPGRTLSYVVNGAAAGSAVTDSTGLASLNYAIPAPAPSGNEPISVAFGGDGGDNPSSGTGMLTVTGTSAPATSLAVQNASGAQGQAVSLSATLTLTGGAGLSGKTLTFSVDGTTVGTAVTNASGVATRTFAIPAASAVGSHPVSVSFAGDGSGAASSGSGTLTVTAGKLATVVTVGARSGKAGTTVVLKSYLKTSGGAALPGRTLNYLVNGVAAGSATTDSTGLASLTYTIPASSPAGNEPIVVSFGGDSGDNPSSGKGTLTVS